jgi:penicillin-binding protein 2
VSGSFSREVKDTLDNDPLKPWINRSIAGQYAPGSTFKPVTALAALGLQGAVAQEKVVCPGYYKMGRHVWRCWKESGHGPMDLHDAMKQSCDTFFYTMGGRTGIDPIAQMARLLSFGMRTGIALRGEQPGNVPDEAFHNRVDASTGGYQRGMAINTSIGQGSLLVTPLQLATAYAAIANGRAVFTPQLVERIETADLRTTRRFVPTGSSTEPDQAQAGSIQAGQAQTGSDGVPRLLAADPTAFVPSTQTEIRGEGPNVTSQFVPKVGVELAIAADSMQQVRQGLQAVTQEPGGTGYWRRSKKVTMAGKTGTAQVVRLGRERLKDWQTEYAERDHAWFVAYAPAIDPEIVVAVLNEHGGHGGSAAMPIAVSVIDAFFELKAARRARAPEPVYKSPSAKTPLEVADP